MRKIFTLAAACAIASATAFAATIDASKVFNLEIPSSLNCDKNTINIYGYHGMGVIALNINSAYAAAQVNKTATAPVTMEFDGKIIGSIEPSNEGQITISSAGMFAEGDVPGTTSLYILYDPGFTSGEYDPAFQQTGSYTLTIPEGTLKVGNDPVGKYQITYNYGAEVAEKVFNWVTSPADGASVKDLSKITLSFPGHSFISYVGNGTKITLTRPNGTKINARSYPQASETSAVLELLFNETTWAPGTYTLTIPKNYLCVDDLYWDEETGNVQEIKATYTVSIDTGAEVIVADGENKIYTIEGVRVNANDLESLPAGLYIVNGKKVVVK